MGNLNQKIARIDVLIGGADQARKAVDQMKKDWDELANKINAARKQMEANTNTVDYDRYKKEYNDLLTEQKQLNRSIKETERNINTVEKYLSDISGQTLRNLGQGKKALNQMLQGVNPQDLKSLQTVRDYIKQISDEALRRKGSLVEFEDVIGNIGTTSDKSLSMAKQRLQELISTTGKNTQEMEKYRSQLAQVEAEENRRISSKARNTLNSVQSGTFTGTIGETKEAVKQLEQFKQTLATTDATGIKQVDEAINILNERLKQTSQSSISYNEAIKQAAQAGRGEFQETYEDLDKIKKALAEYKKQLKVSDTDGLQEIENAFRQIEKAEKKVEIQTTTVDDVLSHIKTASLDDLKIAASKLQEELSKAERNTKEYVTKSADLRKVNAQIDQTTNAWKEHDNQIVKTMKRLASYVLVYAGFNELIGKVKQLTQANLELSDSLADIQKTTGLSAKEVGELSREIDKIDSRTAQESLHELAYEAGKIGIRGKQDLLEFVKAGDQLVVALGEDLGGGEAIRGLMKINDLLGETKRLGVEKALLSTGSAINELSQTSTASAGPIADIVSRLGAVGAQAQLSMSDLIALGGTADELAQEIEVSGTAINKFVTALQTNTHAIAQSIGVDDKVLRNLMDTGKTIDAVILVLERLKNMGGLQETNPIMKEFGSDGDRLKRVISALSLNVETLKQRVDESRTAFEQANSVTNEFNVKNESAMALLQRLGNTIKEAFVNSGFVESIRSFLAALMDLPNWIDRNRAAFLALKIVLAELLLLMAASKWTAFVYVLKSMGSFISGPFIAAWKALKIEIIAAQKAVLLSRASITGLAGALRVLWQVIKSNPLGLFLTVLTAIGVAFYDMATHVSEAAKAEAVHTAQLIKEEMQLKALFDGLKNTNTSYANRKKLIDQINQQYSSYLGFMLSETNSAKELAAAHDLINGKLKERMTLRLQEKRNEMAAEKMADSLQDTLPGLRETLSSSKYITEARSQEAMDIIDSVIMKNIDLDVNDIAAKVKDQLVKQFDTPSWRGYGISLYRDLDKDLNKLIKSQKVYSQEQEDARIKAERDLGEINKQTEKSRVELLNAINEEYNALYTKVGKANGKEAELLNKQMLEKAKQYVSVANEQMNTVSGEQKKFLQKNIDSYNSIIEELTPKQPKNLNVWGEGLSLETASVDKLVAKYKELFDERKTMNEDASYNTIYSSQFTNRAEAMDWYMNKLKEIEGQLAKMGYNTKGSFLAKKKGQKTYSFGGAIKTAKEINDESTATMSALEAYFNNEKMLIMRKYAEKQITEEEQNRLLLKKDEEFIRDRIALRQKLLGRKGGEAFDVEKYTHTEEQVGENTNYFQGKNLNQLKGFISQMGERMTDGMLNKLTEDEVKIMQFATERMAKIQKIILDNDFTEQVNKQYQDELEYLSLFFGETEERTQDSAGKRIKLMSDFSKESYAIDSAGLKQKMAESGEFNEWMEGRTDEHYEALLFMLRKFYDDTEEADNRELTRKKRIADKKWEKTGAKGLWDTTEQSSEQHVSFVKNLNEVGLASNSQVDDAEVKLYETRLLAAQAYYEYLKQSGADTTDAERVRNEAYMELSQKETEITMSKLETLKKYTDSVVEFSEQMGEAAFSEVKDRKDAAKQLLRTTMQITKDLIMEQMKRLIMRKTIGSQEIAQEQTVETAKVLAHGTGAITSLSVEGAKTAAEGAMGISQGASKTIGQLGWWGIPLIAVISAAISALMGLAMGKMNKAKEEVSAATGVSNKGRVAAGMLTYKDGDYPVLGNDGQIYNASYQKELKTGVYRGGAHFGIFSEKKPEMVVDGDTTQQLILNYPHIYDSILTIAKHGRLKSAMPTYASGNYPVPKQELSPEADAGSEYSGQMREMMSGMNAMLVLLNERLSTPLDAVATINPYGNKGAVNQLNIANKFMKKRGLIKE